MIMVECFSLKLVLQLISLILSLYQKHTLISTLLLTITFWKFQATTLFVQTTILTTKEVVFVFIKKKLILTLVNVQYLQESISFELKIGYKTCNFISLQIFKPKPRWLWNLYWKSWIKFIKFGTKEPVLINGNWSL